MNASLRLFTALSLRSERREDRLISVVFLTCICVSVLAGAYTTVLFTLIQQYAKRALGMNMDDRYIAFFEATEKYRISGWRSFVGCLATFSIAFCCSMWLKIELRQYRYVWSTVTLVVVALILGQWFEFCRGVMHSGRREPLADRSLVNFNGIETQERRLPRNKL
eukprot:scaffold2473_cov247-Pinguiococcus_pyrenoidosus.AAC.6